jgi:LCP family protein required for cell wall assembly
MTVYGGGPPPRKPRKRRRGWVRVALWTTGTILLVVLAVVAAGVYMFYGDYSRITSPPKDFRNAENQIDPTLPEANAAAIALVIGSDHRYTDGSAPARSDTLMLVRIDPRTHLISLLSLPRDLWVDIPGHGQDKINAAYSDGGPKLALETVKQVTGLHVNYLIGVNFHSFVSLVNDLGGVYVPVDQAYIHTEAENNALPVSERWSAIDIQPGYQLLNGANALAFSRFRHTDSDFYRTARQQAFLHAFEQKVSARFHGISLTDLGTIKSVIDTISSNVDIAGASGGIGIHTMLNYATLAYSIKGHIISARLQAGTGMIGSASVVEATPGAMKQAVYAFTHPQRIASPTNQLPTAPVKHRQKAHKWRPAVSPATVSLSVLNGTLKTGEAATTAQQLAKFGYTTSSGNAPTQSYNQTWVYYASGHAKAAADIAHIVGHSPPTAPMPAAIASAEDVVVVVGSDFSGKLAVAPPKSGHSSAFPADITPDSQAYLTEFRSVAHQVTFPVLYPTVTQEASNVPSTVPIRAYHIPAAGRHWSSLYAYFELPSTPGANWGIEETRFVDAPILANPSAVRRIGARTYRFYFNGAKIHMIAFVEHGTAYWVQNTLLDDLSNADMIAISKSLAPAG